MGWAAQLLPGLAASDVARLNALPEMTVAAGDVLFRAGDPAQGFAVVLEGRIDVTLTGASGREILLYAIEPGQSCIQTTLALMGDAPYSGDARAVTACRLVMLPQGLFRGLMDQSEVFRGFVFRAFAARMSELTRLLEQVAFARIESRLARALCDMAQGGEVEATHAELAARIGSAREVVSRHMERLVARGLITTERGRITICHADALRQLAV
ncbi:MAG: Crp/Fnr family transcriptional regulator [Roseinatronobacter sp.]